MAHKVIISPSSHVGHAASAAGVYRVYSKLYTAVLLAMQVGTAKSVRARKALIPSTTDSVTVLESVSAKCQSNLRDIGMHAQIQGIDPGSLPQAVLKEVTTGRSVSIACRCNTSQLALAVHVVAVHPVKAMDGHA